MIVEDGAVGFRHNIIEPPEEGERPFKLYWRFLNPGFRKKKVRRAVGWEEREERTLIEASVYQAISSFYWTITSFTVTLGNLAIFSDISSFSTASKDPTQTLSDPILASRRWEQFRHWHRPPPLAQMVHEQSYRSPVDTAPCLWIHDLQICCLEDAKSLKISTTCNNMQRCNSGLVCYGELGTTV